MSKKIKTIDALEVLDSRGDPTIEVTVTLEDGLSASASVPSGASTGTYEAFELRDNDPHRYGGKGTLRAVENVTGSLSKALRGMYANDQERIDRIMRELDGTQNKHRLGANALLGVSLACARVSALSFGEPLYRYLRSLTPQQDSHYLLPIPLINVINGGKHASSNIDIQEFWIIPHAAETFRDRLRQGSEVFHALGAILAQENMDTDLGNEGGYAPNVASHRHVFDMLVRSIQTAGYQPGKDITLGIDAGSSVFYDPDGQTYRLNLEQAAFTAEELSDYYLRLIDAYPIGAMEDPFAEEDWDAWQRFTKTLRDRSPKFRLIGDDVFVTNVERLQKGIDRGVANSVLIKPNQIGTLTETLDCIELAQKNGYDVVISHRSGETTDSFIADLAVAVNAAYIKTGSTARGERIAKYNRLVAIEEELYG